MWILDESASVGRSNYNKLKVAIKEFASRLNFSSTRWGVIEFSGENRKGLYPSTNLLEVAIQQRINLFDNRRGKEEFDRAVAGLVYTPLDRAFCRGSTVPEPCLPPRWYSCISCAFQFALQEYFPNGTNALEGREITIIFVGDGQYNRGNPGSPVEPLMQLRAQYDFKLVFLAVAGNKGVDLDCFGSAFRDEGVPEGR